MHRFLPLIAAGICCASPAFAQEGTPQPQQQGSSTAQAHPAQPGDDHLVKGILKGLVKTVVKQAIEQAQSPKPETPKPEPAAATAAQPTPAPAPPAAPPVFTEAAPAPVKPSQPEPNPAVVSEAVPAPPVVQDHGPAVPAKPSGAPVQAAAAAVPTVSPAPVPAVASDEPRVSAAEPAVPDQSPASPGYLWLLLPAILAVAALASTFALRRGRLLRTKRLLSLATHFDPAAGQARIGPVQLSAPPVSIRTRLDARPAHG